MIRTLEAFHKHNASLPHKDHKERGQMFQYAINCQSSNYEVRNQEGSREKNH